MAPIPLRVDFDAVQLRALARRGRRRMGAGPTASGPSGADDGATRTEAAKIGGVGLQIIRDGVLRFNTRGPDGLLDGKLPPHPSLIPVAPAPPHWAYDRERPDLGSPWRGALAAGRSGAMDLRGVPHHHRQADAQPGTARHGLSQAVSPPAPSCPGGGVWSRTSAGSLRACGAPFACFAHPRTYAQRIQLNLNFTIQYSAGRAKVFSPKELQRTGSALGRLVAFFSRGCR